MTNNTFTGRQEGLPRGLVLAVHEVVLDIDFPPGKLPAIRAMLSAFNGRLSRRYLLKFMPS
jgi:hypothetical protein